jgi:hypothetical protein
LRAGRLHQARGAPDRQARVKLASPALGAQRAADLGFARWVTGHLASVVLGFPAMRKGMESIRTRFSRAVRDRGEGYYYDGRVRLEELDEQGLAGTIRGTRSYRVIVRCAADLLRAWCDCPFVADRVEPCKHLWAALMTADAADALGATLDRHDVVHLSLEPALAAAAGAPELLDPDDFEAEADEVEDDDADGEEAFDALDEVVIFADAWRRGSFADCVLEPIVARQLVVDWREVVAGASTWREASSDLELVTFLDLDAVRTSGVFALALGYRRRTAAGLGSIEPLGPSADLSRFGERLDRRVLELGGFGTYGHASRIALGGDTAAAILPELCQRGRLRALSSSDPALARTWVDFANGRRSGRRRASRRRGARRQESSHDVDYAPLAALPPLAWDGGEPWRVLLGVQAPDGPRSRRAAAHALEVSLVRGEERVDARRARLVHSTGLVLWDDRLARIELGSRRDSRFTFSWLLHARTSDGLQVRASEIDDLFEACLPVPELGLELPSELAFEELRVAPGRVLVLDAPGPRGIEGMAFSDYDGHRVALGSAGGRAVDREARRVVVRDPALEAEARAELARAGFRGSALERLEPDPHDEGRVRIGQKPLANAVIALLGSGWSILGEGLRYRAATHTSASVTTGIDWFELDGAVTFGEQTLSLPELLRALRKQKQKSGFVVLGDGSIGVLPDEWLARFGLLADITPGQEGAPARYSRAQLGIVDACLALVPEAEARVDAAFAKLRDELASFERIELARVPKKFRGELRPYQRLGLGWMKFLERIGFGGCLADDMGLGKTVQVLALLEGARRPRGKARPSLAVVPKSLVFNWVEEAKRFSPELRVLTHHGLNRSEATPQAFAGYDLVITTYGTLRRDVEALL